MSAPLAATAPATARSVRIALAGALVLLGAYWLLGLRVAHGPPGPLDAASLRLAGHAVRVASFLTAAGLFPVYATLCVVLLVAALIRRVWLPAVAIAIVALVVAWRVSDTFKVLFARPRPAHWFGHHETSFAYASGHATLALTFYGFWAYVAWRSGLPLPARAAIVAALGVWIAAIGWSRLALGAHYASDVAGGYLLGGGFLALAVAAGELRRDR